MKMMSEWQRKKLEELKIDFNVKAAERSLGVYVSFRSHFCDGYLTFTSL